MLAGDFYQVREMHHENGTVEALLEINKVHPIFDGHFPGQPVVPGVCMIQMVKEILGELMEKTLQLSNAEQVKFLNMINPNENNLVGLQVKYITDPDGSLRVDATLKSATATYFKLRGSFRDGAADSGNPNL